ncbi:enoyl-CoA hydratase/isomerase family protein [Haloarcula salinisoli]|uniref:Enoyl-CoA hydratase/isomerase family protein n=1 Tax=Haloarcula salinisoli TaxID=2487746 RepID=A0A8J8CC88_9EURY|nr:enoyl-CoA hydratase-related protein [Halomicroarcula salinisoli]MBX0285331.1 enoyl-CoA hydratase/isomerase family protein [Halomicroarcula salinisoli]MBX0303190.1 enoyl-CoA hydratase/isomerase family protein [Halomicroarcula salinisoli]
MTEDAVRLTIDDGVATVTLNRPDERNALAEPTAARLVERFEAVADTDARCVLVRGAGSAFCAGGDVAAMVDGVDSDRPPTERVGTIETINEAVEAVHDCRLPVVAAIDGPAFGAGAGLALACDIQLASPDAKIGFGSRRLGLPIDAGVSYFLPRVVGPNKAKELVFTGELLDADTARELGVFTRLFERDSFEAGVENLVETIAEGPTVALSQAKQLIDRGATSTLDGAMEREAAAQGLAVTTDDHAEGAAAFIEQREPDFSGH